MVITKNQLTAILWLVIIGAGGTLELFGLINPNDWTFSALVRTWVPIYVRIPVLAWVFFHFVFQKNK